MCWSGWDLGPCVVTKLPRGVAASLGTGARVSSSSEILGDSELIYRLCKLYDSTQTWVIMFLRIFSAKVILPNATWPLLSVCNQGQVWPSAVSLPHQPLTSQGKKDSSPVKGNKREPFWKWIILLLSHSPVPVFGKSEWYSSGFK